MKFSIPITCQCGHQLTLNGSGTQPIADAQCTECHSPIWAVPGLADEVGIRILHRAFTDLQNDDFTISIVLGAMAVECELSRLFIKWQGIDFSMANSSDAPDAQKEVWVKQWSGMTRIKLRLDTISVLLTKEPFDAFVSQNTSLLTSVYTKYPISKTYSSTKEFLQKEFFNRRNKIVHYGQIDFQQDDAEMCAAIALSLMHILKAMDKQRYKTTFN